MNYWLMKTEPDEFSIDDLAKRKTEPWSGVRNYQARNYMRDDEERRSACFSITPAARCPASSASPKSASEAHRRSDASSITKSDYYDAKSKRDNPRWSMVEVKFKKQVQTQRSR